MLDVGDVSEDRFPRWSTIRYDFPKRGDLHTISVFWYEGSKPNPDGTYKSPGGKPARTRPNHPAALAEIERLDKNAKSLAGAGNLFVGDKGWNCL